MVVTGATRLVAVKSLYQLDFENPWLVTLLYLTGQALSLIVYWLLPCLGQDNNDDNDDNDINHHNKTNGSYEAVSNPLYTNHKDMSSSSSSTTTTTILTKKEEKEETTTTIELASLESTATKTTIDDPMVVDSEEQLLVLGRGDDDKETEETQPTADNNPRRRWLLRQGSETGLTPESKTAVAWIHSIPWYFQPILPGICNAMNGAMRWASLLFVRASIAEMLISGLELVLSAVAARVLRQRTISTLRWCGVGVVTIGMLLVRFADLVLSSHPNNNSNNNNNNNNNNDYAITNSTATTTTTTTTSINSSSRRDIWISTLLIIGQCIMSVLQDLAEEVFMQEAHVPATLLLGMEGLFGLVLGIPVYLWLVPDSAKVFSAMNSSDDGDGTITTTTTTMVLYPYLIALTLLFTVTGIFNILATSVTSSMTRNVWKNLRTMLVWIFGLVVYYYHYYGNPSSCPSSSSSSPPPPPPPRLGEAWEFPESAIVMLGFGIMLGGIGIYYLDSRLAGVEGYVPLSTMATSGAKEGGKEEDEDDNKYDNNNNKESTMEKGSGIQES